MNEQRKTLPAVSVAVVRGDTVLLVKRARPPVARPLCLSRRQGRGRRNAGGGGSGANCWRKPGCGADDYRPLREIHIDGSGENHPVDYRLTVFGAAYAGGEAVASDDAETAAFYTLGEMATLPLAGSVFAGGRGACWRSSNRRGTSRRESPCRRQIVSPQRLMTPRLAVPRRIASPPARLSPRGRRSAPSRRSSPG